ncbi:GTP-binding A [Paramuricea clavata]|uniref:GTP-binding A n=1 Tax=Paramuricea clavata TaxID=317549 RepID=A0A6S7IYS3_PARCT|nr:GTP-binding A [Paramuricea clavata]
MAMESVKNVFGSFYTTSPVSPVSEPSIKPVPASAEDFRKELKSFQKLDRHSEPPPRAKLYYYILSSAKIKRPFESAVILLVGGSGVGKLSTINHLLDTGKGDPVAMTSATESETKRTTEYILTIDEPNLEVCDLQMGVIDTPGFNDTAGVNQDACNFVSIKRFFQTHPSLSEQWTYPNLVFLVVSANDKRIKGPNSNLSKCLRGIKLLEVVDTICPNLVVILTSCCSVGHKNVNKWEEKMEEKKEVISNIVYEVLGVLAPVVLIENDNDDEHELEKDGDFTLLPNGEKQPKNLYNACLELLERNKDRFGLMVFNSSFTRAKKGRPASGHETEAKDSRVEALSDEEEEFSNAFSEASKGEECANRSGKGRQVTNTAITWAW